MKPGSCAASAQLEAMLARRGVCSAPDLAAALGVSVPTLHRLLAELGDRVIPAGRARRARYALRRPLRGDGSPLPLYEVGDQGDVRLVTTLALRQPQGAWMDLAGTGLPVPEASRDGWWDGLPYPLADMRPQGFMGRQLARAEQFALEVPGDPNEWSDDDVCYALARVGTDVSGSFILGDRACQRWLGQKASITIPLRGAAVGPAYAELAQRALGSGTAGSSAAGEFPKFAATRELADSDTQQVLVKFSGADDSPAVRRWADLLVCEHLALEAAATMAGVEGARSRIVTHAGRTFLEAERFDRHGLFGRSRIVTLDALNGAFIGAGTSDWVHLARRLAADGLLAADELRRVERVWWFGRLIANTDMHLGNVSFRSRAALSLAPVYDMLPMLYAPLPGGEVPARTFQPPVPLPQQQDAWTSAAEAALQFWRQAARDARIGEAFRAVCADNADSLDRAADRPLTRRSNGQSQ